MLQLTSNQVLALVIVVSAYCHGSSLASVETIQFEDIQYRPSYRAPPPPQYHSPPPQYHSPGPQYHNLGPGTYHSPNPPPHFGGPRGPAIEPRGVGGQGMITSRLPAYQIPVYSPARIIGGVVVPGSGVFYYLNTNDNVTVVTANNGMAFDVEGFIRDLGDDGTPPDGVDADDFTADDFFLQ
jgi:hypothetical protein